jgi:putative inorganic carbon (hco3(-)) transporter
MRSFFAMEDGNKARFMLGASLSFIVLNVFFIANEIYWFMALPFAVIVLFMLFFSLDKLLWIIVFLTPFSFQFKHSSMGFAIDMPTEPIIAAVMVLFLLKLWYNQKYDFRILKHPLTIVLLLGLLWMFITTVTSELPLVSAKYFVSRLWFVVTFYFVLIQLFNRTENISNFLWIFATGLVMIIIYITILHSTYDFDRKIGTWLVRPFFNDHTNYSAVIAFIAPTFLIFTFLKKYSPLRRSLALTIFAVFLMGVILSYSRASWISIMAAFGAFWILIFKISYKWIFAGLIIIIAAGFLFQNQILMNLERNRQESSGDFAEHAQSITNISSDASNLERINRWRSAIRLFQERPLFGWGPGTYQMVYAPFQLSEDETIITTNIGDMGNAHSEYLGPLADSGLPGMLLFMALAVIIFITGLRNIKNAKTKELRRLSLGITLGFITYLTHGFLNNFLDTDKASVLFWGFAAILVAIDIYHSQQPQNVKSYAAMNVSGTNPENKG